MMSEIISLTRLQAADDTQQWSGEVRLSHGAEIGRKIINDPRQGDQGRNKQYVAQNHSSLSPSLPYYELTITSSDYRSVTLTGLTNAMGEISPFRR